MIKINLSDAEKNRISLNHFLILIKPPFEIGKKLYRELHTPGIRTAKRNFYCELTRNLKRIIVSKPNVLEDIRIILLPLYNLYVNDVHTLDTTGKSKKKIKKEIKDEILNIFNYDKFIKHNEKQLAYNLAESLKMNVCPYCNRQYIHTINKVDRKTRPEFDHFYDKARYPFFALSFYNLIPSCSNCNSPGLKGTSKFNIEDNLNPFVDDGDEIFKFSIEISAADFIDLNKKSYEIKTKEANDDVTVSDYERAKNNIRTFYIDELYNKHKDYVSEIIYKAYIYSKYGIKDFLKIEDAFGNKLFNSEQEILELILGNYIRKDKLGDRVLSKLTKDIATELGLVK